MKKLLSVLFVAVLLISCKENNRPQNTSAKDEQAHTENNQQRLNQNQPLPNITWSMERDNLIKLKKLQKIHASFLCYLKIKL
mgnify:CR=1 FL=1